jgi:hypothetical protein
MRCLIIKQPYLDEILAGTKTVEFRSRATKIRGRIGLIQSGRKGEILGTVELYDCRKGAHAYEWLLRGARRLPLAVQFQQNPGCVVWVLGPEIAEEIGSKDPCGCVRAKFADGSVSIQRCPLHGGDPLAGGTVEHFGED